jgi:hypothetical protein
MAKGLTVKIRADASQFDKTMGGVKKGLNNVGGPLKKVGVAAAAAGAAIVGAGVAAGVLVKNLILVGEGANTASARTANAVKQMGVFGEQSAEVAARLDEVATATALQTGIDKKSIQMTQAKLATFKELLKSADQQEGVFDRVTMAAINLAAAGFGSAEENAVQLGKAFSDVEAGLTALKRAGTLTREEIEDISSEFKATGNQGKAFERVLKALEVQSKNAAGATADGTKRIGVAWQLVKEEIGKPIADAFSKFADDIAKNTPQILAAIEAMKPKIQEAASGIFTAISDAVAGDMRKLTMIGTFIGEVIGAGIKIGLTRALLEVGQGFWKTLEDVNPIRNYLMSEESKGKNKISDYIASGKSSVTSGQVEDAISDIMKNYSALMQELNVNAPPVTNNTTPVNNSKSLEINAMLEMNSILKDIKRNTEPHLFPSQ